MTEVRKPAYRARAQLVLADGFNPTSRREIEPGEHFDATTEELQGLVLGRDYELSSKMRPLDKGITGKLIARERGDAA